MDNNMTFGSQRGASQVMMVMDGNQVTFDSPVYMVQSSAPPQQPSSAGFLQHRRSIGADPQQRPQPQHYQSMRQTGPSVNHNIEVVQQQQQIPQYKVPNPIMTGSSLAQPQPIMHDYGYRMNPSPTYMTQPSPTQQISPYCMVQQSPNNDVGQHLSSTPNHGQTQFAIGQQDTSTQQGQQHQTGQQQPQHLSLSLDQGQIRYQQTETPHTITPLTSTFLQYMPFQSESSATGKTDQSQQFYVQQQQSGQQQQFPVIQQHHISPQSQGHGLQAPVAEPRIQTLYTIPVTNAGQEFAYTGHRESPPAVAHAYQQPHPTGIENMVSTSHSMQHDSARFTNLHPPDPGINHRGSFGHHVPAQLAVSNTSGYTTMHPSAKEMPSYPEGSRAVWSPYQQRMMGPQNASVRASFPTSYRGNPALNGEVIMFADDGEEEEYSSTMVFDPYVVRIEKLMHEGMVRSTFGKMADAANVLL